MCAGAMIKIKGKGHQYKMGKDGKYGKETDVQQQVENKRLLAKERGSIMTDETLILILLIKNENEKTQ